VRSARFFCFQADARLRIGGKKTKKPEGLRQQDWLFIWASTQRGTRAKRAISLRYKEKAECSEA
jgi:hypothetical protein